MTAETILEDRPIGPDEIVLTKEDVARIGRAIGSETYWQANVGRKVGYSKSTITRYLNGSRPTTPMLGHAFRHAIVDKVSELAALLSIEGLPDSGDWETRQAQDLINEAVGMLRRVEAREEALRKG